MRKSKFTETQIVSMIKEAESGMPVPEICRKHGIGQSTFYKWRSKYGGMEASDVKRLKELEEENREIFEHAGGENYRYIPALNDRDDHIHALYDVIEPYL